MVPAVDPVLEGFFRRADRDFNNAGSADIMLVKSVANLLIARVELHAAAVLTPRFFVRLNGTEMGLDENVRCVQRGWVGKTELPFQGVILTQQ